MLIIHVYDAESWMTMDWKKVCLIPCFVTSNTVGTTTIMASNDMAVARAVHLNAGLIIVCRKLYVFVAFFVVAIVVVILS